MLASFLKRFRKINAPQPPEGSVPLRLSVALTVLVAIGSIAYGDAVPKTTTLTAMAAVSIGSWLSYRRRETDNWKVKLALTFLLFPVFGNFLTGFSRYWYDPRIPMAVMFIWMQALHSFDLPSRRDLMFSLLSALTIAVMGAVLSIDMTYGSFLLAFFALALLSLWLARRAECGLTGWPGSDEWRSIVKPTLAIVLLACLVFGLTPFFPRYRLGAFPFSVPRLRIPGFTGQFQNDAYGLRVGQFPMDALPYVRGAYPGLATFMDLRMRGLPAGDLMLRVRSSEAVYHRGLAFTDYNGKGWTMSKPRLVKLSARIPPVNVPGAFSPRSREVFQTYYVESDHPNVIFAAFQPSQMYFPGLELWLDQDSCLRSPYMLDFGVVYTAVSRITDVDVATLRASSARPWPDEDGRFLARYRRIRTVPARLKALAMRLTKGKADDYDKAAAIAAYLEKDCSYSLETAPPDKGKDAVDDFVFDKRAGGCEQFASAMAVLCRLADVPCRVVTGYAEGRYNPFTGFYEVRDSDGHAWTEVWLGPRAGWVAMEPSPGFAFPARSSSDRFFLSALVRFAMKSRLGSGLRGLGRLIGSVPKAATFAVVALAALLLGWSALPALRRRRSSPADPVSLAYGSMLKHYSRRSLPRQPGETPREYATRLLEAGEPAQVTELTRLFSDVRYGGSIPDANLAGEAQALLDSLTLSAKDSPEH